MQSFVMMLSFFTRIPVGAVDGIDETAYRKGIKWLPVIGLLLGAATGAVSLLRSFTGPYAAAFLAVLVYLLLTGGLHTDGLADTADAFGARRDRERTLAILKDSHIGAFGALALIVLVVGDTVALAEAGRAAWLFPLAGRAAALVAARVFPCARPGGLGQWFIGGVKWGHVVFAAALYAAAALAASVDWSRTAWQPGTFAVLMAAFMLAVGLVLWIVSRFARRIGGITGDIVGFTVEASQLFYILAAVLLQGVL